MTLTCRSPKSLKGEAPHLQLRHQNRLQNGPLYLVNERCVYPSSPFQDYGHMSGSNNSRHDLCDRYCSCLTVIRLLSLLRKYFPYLEERIYIKINIYQLPYSLPHIILIYTTMGLMGYNSISLSIK